MEVDDLAHIPPPHVKRGILRRMRNTILSYQLCKFIYDNSEIHPCYDSCPANDKIGTPLVKDLQKNMKKHDRANRIYKYLLMQEYCERKKYIEVIRCPKYEITFLRLMPDGIGLTDNIFLPFTPIGLWKEIWKDHKVLFTLLPTLIATLTGSGIFQVVRWAVTKFS